MEFGRRCKLSKRDFEYEPIGRYFNLQMAISMKSVASNLATGRRSLLVPLLVVWLSCLVNGERTFNTDCSANTRLKCRAEEGSCANYSQSVDHPSAPFDLRISPYVVATPRAKPDSYQLWVNISWRPTYARSINKTEGFLLKIVDKDTDEEECFAFVLEQPQWQDDDRHTSIRFGLSTVDLFHYGHHYSIEVHSLPKPPGGTEPWKDNFIRQEIVMPVHPEQFWLEQLNRTGYFDSLSPDEEAASAHCVSPSSASAVPHGHPAPAHPHATQWIAAFRYVYIQPKGRFIYVDFVAAPPQYCFEEYELRLLKDMHYIIDHTTIHRKDLYYETHANVSVAFGRHTFHNVTPGVYEIGVIPVDRSEIDSRCLCPSFGQICACRQAVWPDVEMPEPPTLIGPPADPCAQLPPVKLPFDCPRNVTDDSHSPIGPSGSHGITLANSIVALSCLLIGALIVIVVGAVALKYLYRRYKRGGIPRMYLLPVGDTIDFHSKNSPSRDGISVMTELTPIVHPVKVLIIYARDCPFHEAAVRSLDDYLRKQCMCDVSIDYSCSSEIDGNKFDWAYKSIAEADRVILINSYGAYLRYQGKLMADYGAGERPNGHTPRSAVIIERVDPSPYDDLFLLQLDLITQHQRREQNNSKFISLHFSYTCAQFILPHANPYVRFEIPNHLTSLVVHLHNLHRSCLDADEDGTIPPRLKTALTGDYANCPEGEQLRRSIENMHRYSKECPNWFENHHIRRPVQTHLISPYKELSTPNQTGEFVPLEQPESRHDFVMTSWPLPPTTTHSGADSGYDEAEAANQETHLDENIGEPCQSTAVLFSEVPYTDAGANSGVNNPLLENDHKYSKATESADSGVLTDLSSATDSTLPFFATHPSPKMNGVLKGMSKTDLDAAAIERLRLLC